MISVHFQGRPLNITVIQIYAPTSNAEKAEIEQLYEDLQDLQKLTHTQIYLFHCRRLECKRRKSRDTWSNRQIWPWNTKRSRAKLSSVLPKECSSHSKHLLPTTQEKTPHGHHQIVTTKIRLIISSAAKMQNLYIVSKNKTKSWLWLRSWTP